MLDRPNRHLRLRKRASTLNRTKPTLDSRRFRAVERARSFSKTQMTVRTVKHGLISRESSLALARELFPTLRLDEVTDLFTETKQRYLWSRDLEAG